MKRRQEHIGRQGNKRLTISIRPTPLNKVSVVLIEAQNSLTLLPEGKQTEQLHKERDREEQDG